MVVRVCILGTLFLQFSFLTTIKVLCMYVVMYNMLCHQKKASHQPIMHHAHSRLKDMTRIMGLIQIQFGGGAESEATFFHHAQAHLRFLRYSTLYGMIHFVCKSIFLRVTINSHALSLINIAALKSTKSPKIYE